MQNRVAKRKILFIVTRSENGGAQRWVKEQIDIVGDHFETHIVTDEEGWLIQHAKMDGYMTDMRIHQLHSFMFLLRFADYLKKHHIDLVVAGTANAGVYGRLVQLLYRVNVLYVSHGWASIYNGGKMTFVYTTVERMLSKVTKSVMCVSQSDYDRAKNEVKIEPQKLIFMRNKSLPMKRRPNIGQLTGRPKIVSVARFKHPKRQDLLIEAVRDMDVDLYLVGDGPSREANELKAGSNVYFLGEIDGFDDFYKYDIFALISDSEGLPLSGVEAMGVGLPLLLSDVGGCPELIEENGLVVENNIEEIRKGLEAILENYEKFAHNSIKLFDREYNLERHKMTYIDYYQRYIPLER